MQLAHWPTNEKAGKSIIFLFCAILKLALFVTPLGIQWINKQPHTSSHPSSYLSQYQPPARTEPNENFEFKIKSTQSFHYFIDNNLQIPLKINIPHSKIYYKMSLDLTVLEQIDRGEGRDQPILNTGYDAGKGEFQCTTPAAKLNLLVELKNYSTMDGVAIQENLIEIIKPICPETNPFQLWLSMSKITKEKFFAEMTAIKPNFHKLIYIDPDTEKEPTFLIYYNDALLFWITIRKFSKNVSKMNPIWHILQTQTVRMKLSINKFYDADEEVDRLIITKCKNIDLNPTFKKLRQFMRKRNEVRMHNWRKVMERKPEQAKPLPELDLTDEAFMVERNWIGDSIDAKNYVNWWIQNDSQYIRQANTKNLGFDSNKISKDIKNYMMSQTVKASSNPSGFKKEVENWVQRSKKEITQQKPEVHRDGKKLLRQVQMKQAIKNGKIPGNYSLINKNPLNPEPMFPPALSESQNRQPTQEPQNRQASQEIHSSASMPVFDGDEELSIETHSVCPLVEEEKDNLTRILNTWVESQSASSKLDEEILDLMFSNRKLLFEIDNTNFALIQEKLGLEIDVVLFSRNKDKFSQLFTQLKTIDNEEIFKEYLKRILESKIEADLDKHSINLEVVKSVQGDSDRREDLDKYLKNNLDFEDFLKKGRELSELESGQEKKEKIQKLMSEITEWEPQNDNGLSGNSEIKNLVTQKITEITQSKDQKGTENLSVKRKKKRKKNSEGSDVEGATVEAEKGELRRSPRLSIVKRVKLSMSK